MDIFGPSGLPLEASALSIKVMATSEKVCQETPWLILRRVTLPVQDSAARKFTGGADDVVECWIKHVLPFFRWISDEWELTTGPWTFGVRVIECETQKSMYCSIVVTLSFRGDQTFAVVTQTTHRNHGRLNSVFSIIFNPSNCVTTCLKEFSHVLYLLCPIELITQLVSTHCDVSIFRLGGLNFTHYHNSNCPYLWDTEWQDIISFPISWIFLCTSSHCDARLWSTSPPTGCHSHVVPSKLHSWSFLRNHVDTVIKHDVNFQGTNFQ